VANSHRASLVCTRNSPTPIRVVDNLDFLLTIRIGFPNIGALRLDPDDDHGNIIPLRHPCGKSLHRADEPVDQYFGG